MTRSICRSLRNSSELTLDMLRSLLSYDSETGVFLWKVKRGRSAAGYRAGRIGGDGYRIIEICGRPYKASRLAWFYSHGKWPTGRLDHKDCIRDRDHLTNLREASGSENAANSRKRKSNTSGFKGVSFDHGKRKWMAGLTKDGKFRFLGRYESKEEAAVVYEKAAVEAFGNFARVS